MPLLTVIIVNWNGKQHLDDCLGSLRRQTFRDFEIVLVDNGSQDGSVSFVRENYPEVSIVVLPNNQGFCAPNNLAIAQTQSEYVCLLNNDTELDPECLSALVQTMEEDPQTGICDARQLLFDQRDVVHLSGAEYTIAGSTAAVRDFSAKADADANRECFIGNAACVVYRRAMLSEIGLFDEDFFAGCEDTDLSFRAHLAGYRVQNVGRARCYHKISATHRANSAAFVRRGQRNLHWVYFKNMPSSLLRRYLAHHILYTLITALYFFRIGRGRAWMQAKVAVLRSMPRLLEKRQHVQKLKRVSDQETEDLLAKRWLGAPDKRRKILSAWGIDFRRRSS